MKIKKDFKLKDFRNYLVDLLVSELNLSKDSSFVEVDFLLEKKLSFITSKSDFFSKSDNLLYQREVNLINSLIDRRLKGEPLSYIVSEKEFYGRNFYIDKRVLIPRPETEHLIEEALNIAKQSEELILLDIGTGSGIIPITLSLELESNKLIPKYIVASDISSDALEVARINSKKLLKNYENVFFIQSNLLDFFNLNNFQIKPDRTTHIIITGNLPYIDINDDSVDESVRNYEPMLALFSEDKGLSLILKLIDKIYKIRKKLKKESFNINTILEIGENQSYDIVSYLNNLGISKVEVIKDYSNKNRILSIEF